MAEGQITVLRARAMPAAPIGSDLQGALRDRMRGPGGSYNLANVLILFTGIGLQVRASLSEGDGLSSAIFAYFLGSPEATLLAVAMTCFIVGGELYHRAWADPLALDLRLIRLGDLSCGIAAAFFTVALVLVGDPALGLVGGLGMTIARFGLFLVPFRGRGIGMHRLLRRLIVLCRMPQILSVVLALGAIWRLAGAPIDYVAPTSVLIGILLSLRADLMFGKCQ